MPEKYSFAKSIVKSWEAYCLSMGSKPAVHSGMKIYLNKSLPFSCGYANCIINFSPGLEEALIAISEFQEKKESFPGIALYEFLPLPGFVVPPANEERRGSLMALENEDVPLLIKNLDSLKLQSEDASLFLKTVFEAFNYPKKNFAPTLENLNKTLKETKSVHMFGEKFGTFFPTVLLTHDHDRFINIEMVATLDSYRHKGLATRLLREVIRMLREDQRTFWLWAEDNSDAKKLYETIGFKTRYAISVLR